MKTPMQELIERLEEKRKHYSSEFEMDIVAGLGYAIDHAESMLEKEKDVMCEFAKLYDDDLSNGIIRTREDLFNETFNTKER